MNFTSNNTHPGEFGGELQAPEVEQPQDSPLTLEWIDRMVRQPETSQGADVGRSSPPEQAPAITPDSHSVAEAPCLPESHPVICESTEEMGDPATNIGSGSQVESDLATFVTATPVSTEVVAAGQLSGLDQDVSIAPHHLEGIGEASADSNRISTSSIAPGADQSSGTPIRFTDSNDQCSLDRLKFQPSVHGQVELELLASRLDNRPFDNALLVGGAGLGKSYAAKIIANQIRTNFHTAFAQELGSIHDFEGLLKSASDFDVILLDEAHLLRVDVQTHLYKLIDARKPITFLLGTTDPHKLLTPLRQRLRLVLSFGYYGKDSLEQMLSRQCEEDGWQFDQELCGSIAGIARGTPRTAIGFLHEAHRVTRARGGDVVTHADFQEALLRADYNDRGLSKNEQQYLEIVKGGIDTLSCISAVMGIGTATISANIEPDLIRLGHLKIGRNSRRILLTTSPGGAADPIQQVVPTQSVSEHHLYEKIRAWFSSNPECLTVNGLALALDYSYKPGLSRALRALVQMGEMEFVPKGAIRPSRGTGTQRHDGYRLRPSPTSLTSSEPDVPVVVARAVPQPEAIEALSNTDQPERQSAIAGSTEPVISESEIGAEATENDSTSTSPQSPQAEENHSSNSVDLAGTTPSVTQDTHNDLSQRDDRTSPSLSRNVRPFFQLSRTANPRGRG